MNKAALFLIVLLGALPVIACSNTLPSTEQVADEGDGTDDSGTGRIGDDSINDSDGNLGDGSPAGTEDLNSRPGTSAFFLTIAGTTPSWL